MNQATFVRGLVVGAGMVAALGGSASAAIGVFMDLPTYQGAGGFDGITVDFDSIAADTNIDGQTINGVRFNRIGSPLIVVDGASTFTPDGVFSNTPNLSNNTLTPTSGANLLSPGGKELGSGDDLDRDTIEITLDIPVQSMAFDMMYQSLDGFTFISFDVFDSDGNFVFSSGVGSGVSPDGNAGGVQFYGLISDGLPIKTIVISEGDHDQTNPDANIGIDTIRTGIPAPGTAIALGVGITVLGRRRRA